MDMKYDATVTLGNILQFVGMVVLVGGLYVKVVERITKVETRLDGLIGDIGRRIEVSVLRMVRGRSHKLNEESD